MDRAERARTAFRRQADFCDAMDAPKTAAIARGLADVLDRDTQVGRVVLDWSGDPIADALPLRLVGGLHALHRAGAAVGFDRDIDRLRAALVEHEAALLPWLDGPPQTNEPGRSAALMTGLLHLAERYGPRFELLELGSSAGLNLLIDRYRFDLGGVAVGPQSPVLIRPEWRGNPPPEAAVEVVSVRGVDVAPIDLTDPAAADRLAAYVWIDATERQARLDRAIAMVRDRGVRLDRGDAAEWLDVRLAEPQPAGVTRVVLHSVVWQYLGSERQARIRDAIHAAGARATAERPFGWVMLEPNRDLAAHEVRVRGWPGGQGMEVVAHAHAHGAWVDGLAVPEVASDYVLSGVAPV
ncbi:DUF2332 domain-containing protein [Sphingomonas floccifaciens]|uniref:DUF2332 domain-containing protein n=1 Tax=Sphingomonas floccifaciens TaxID=1844115 RepID=A0ABW4NCF5_9SPHN